MNACGVCEVCLFMRSRGFAPEPDLCLMAAPPPARDLTLAEVLVTLHGYEDMA